jgi:hypothetical protein
MMLSAPPLLGFLPGAYYFFWHKRFGGHGSSSFGARRPARATVPSDRDDATIEEGAGEIDSFPGSSIWPFVMGMGAFLTVLSLVFGIWLILPRHHPDPHRAGRRHRREPARRHV